MHQTTRAPARFSTARFRAVEGASPGSRRQVRAHVASSTKSPLSKKTRSAAVSCVATAVPKLRYVVITQTISIVVGTSATGKRKSVAPTLLSLAALSLPCCLGLVAGHCLFIRGVFSSETLCRSDSAVAELQVY